MSESVHTLMTRSDITPGIGPDMRNVNYTSPVEGYRRQALLREHYDHAHAIWAKRIFSPWRMFGYVASHPAIWWRQAGNKRPLIAVTIQNLF